MLVEDLILTKSKDTSFMSLKPYLAQLSDSLSTRLTLIDLTGDVVFDTSKSQKVFDNHLSRPEIVDALSLGKGFSKRYSQSYSETFIYYAIRLKVPTQFDGVLRLSVPVVLFKVAYGEYYWMCY